MKNLSEAGPDYFSVSVVVPVYNDPDGIKDTLDSLATQEYPPHHFEVIVVDNGSTDHTAEVIREYVRDDPKIRLETEYSVHSSYAARNKGIRSSRGSIIAFMDADMTVRADWLTKINRSLQEHNGDYLACGVEVVGRNRTIYEIYDRITGFPIGSYLHDDHFAPTCCLVARKSLFIELGFFDPRLISGGDLEFGNRAYQSGKKLCYDPDIVMMHPARSSFRALYKKLFRVGRGLRQLTVFYPERYHDREYGAWNPLNYIPRTPWNFFRSYKGNDTWDELQFTDKIRVYCINWVLQLTKLSGYRYESRRSGRE
jgi:glycosyltransferase involved in cell wall biosynthesis